MRARIKGGVETFLVRFYSSWQLLLLFTLRGTRQNKNT
jgi:hypothetical protein